MNNVKAYFDLLEDSRQGLYTPSEVVAVSIDLLYESSDRVELWESFREEHRDCITKFLINFDESDPLFALNADPLRVRRATLALKGWLIGHAGARES
jgi:hypothetical protein